MGVDGDGFAVMKLCDSTDPTQWWTKNDSHNLMNNVDSTKCLDTDSSAPLAGQKGLKMKNCHSHLTQKFAISKTAVAPSSAMPISVFEQSTCMDWGDGSRFYSPGKCFGNDHQTWTRYGNQCSLGRGWGYRYRNARRDSQNHDHYCIDDNSNGDFEWTSNAECWKNDNPIGGRIHHEPALGRTHPGECWIYLSDTYGNVRTYGCAQERRQYWDHIYI